MPEADDSAAFLDLSGVALSNALLDQALVAAHKRLLRQDMAALLDAADPAARALAEAILDRLAETTAELETLRQARAAPGRRPAERLRVDPLPMIPEERAPNAPIAPDAYELELDGVGFNGAGWHGPEHDGISAYRWSGAARPASLLLPSLGGGAIRLRAWFGLPFDVELSPADLQFLANAEAVAPSLVIPTPRGFQLEFDLVLPPDDGIGRFVFTMDGPSFADTRAGAHRDARQLGPGLWRLSLEKRRA